MTQAGEQLHADQQRTRRRVLMLAVGAVLVAVGVSYVLDPEAFRLRSAELTVITEPAGAEVRLDGELLGQTPLTVPVSEGERVLRIEHRYHESVVERILIDGDVRQQITLPAATGGAEIVSNPRGSTLVLDGVPLEGVTPLTVTELATGEHEVTASFANHRPVTQTFEVLPGEQTRVLLDLILVPWGTLTVTTDPEEARVTFVDRDTPYQDGMQLPLGEYPLEVSAPNYPTRVERVKVRMGNNATHIVLERREVPLRVLTTPADALVNIEYELGGVPRVRPYGNTMMAPMGPVTVVARLPGYRTVRRNVGLGAQGATVRIALERFVVDAGHVFSDTLVSGGTGPQLVVLPPGRFRMGDLKGHGSADERPVREVHLTQPFAIGVYEVTHAEFARYEASRGRTHKLGRGASDDHPAAFVGIEDAEGYLRWLSKETTYQYRLPSEAEWEYAARAGVENNFLHGDDLLGLCEYANIADQSTLRSYSTWEVAECNDGFTFTAPVGSLKPNAFGLYDVLGNVSEWVADCWSSDYSKARSDEVAYRPTEDCHQIFRGGSWDSRTDTVRLSYRQSSDRGNDDRGLRVVREL